MSGASRYSGWEEDRIDRWFNRRLALPVAHLSAGLGLHPNTVSIVGMVLGVVAGTFFRFQALDPVLWGAGILVLATIVDNADGMVARMTGKSSEFGYVLDGVCDNLVFGSIYICSIIGIWNEPSFFGGAWGGYGLLLGVAAAYSHSHQSAMLDFYKQEWRYWAAGSDGHRFRPPAALRVERAGATGFARLFLGLRMGHSRQQERLARARRRQSPSWDARRQEAGFADTYAALNWLPMKGWFFLGPNWHVIAVIVFGLLGRMELYFVSQILLFNLVLLISITLQAARDRRLTATLGGAPASVRQDDPKLPGEAGRGRSGIGPTRGAGAKTGNGG